MEDRLAKQREEMQRAQKLQTEASNFEVHKLNIQTDAQKTILTAAADSLGEMGNMNLGGGSGGGMNPAGMMTGMMMGGAMGNQMAGMMNQMGDNMNPQTPPNNQMPPPPPETQYLLSVNGQQAGPFNPVRNEHFDLIARYNDELQDWNAMFEATSRMVHSGRPNPFPTSSFLILNRSYFDTSFEPNYLHLKATINANKPADLIKNAKDLLLTRHRIGTLPDYVVDLIQVANRIAGEEVQEKKEPLQGVFGATK
jgi:hypothetical protein